MKSFLKQYLLVTAIALTFLGSVQQFSASAEKAAAIKAAEPIEQQAGGTPYANFSAAFGMPILTGVGTSTLNYGAGTIYAGGVAEGIVAGTLAMSSTQGTCLQPFEQAATACNFVYWTSGTGLSTSTSYATAYGGGANVVVAFVATNSSGNITAITPSSLTLPPLADAFVSSCGTTATCTPTTVNLPRTIVGTVAMASATTVQVTAIAPAFTSTTSFVCTASDPNHGTYTYTITVNSASAFTITSGTSNSDTWAYACTGY